MSIAAVKWARGLKLTRSTKVVLLVLAERADKSGVCFPDLDLIASETSLSRSTAIRALRALAKAGALEREIRYDKRGKRTSNLYRLNVDTKCQIDTKTKCQRRPSLSVNEASTKCHRGGDHYIEATVKPQEEREKESLSLAKTKSEPPKKRYAFDGLVIRLNEQDYERWRKLYSFLPDYEAELRRADEYYADHGSQNWFHRVSRWLAKANEEARLEDWHIYASVDFATEEAKQHWYARHEAAKRLVAGMMRGAA